MSNPVCGPDGVPRANSDGTPSVECCCSTDCPTDCTLCSDTINVKVDILLDAPGGTPTVYHVDLDLAKGFPGNEDETLCGWTNQVILDDIYTVAMSIGCVTGPPGGPPFVWELDVDVLEIGAVADWITPATPCPKGTGDVTWTEIVDTEDRMDLVSITPL